MPIVKLRVSRVSGGGARASEGEARERGGRETTGYEPFEKPHFANRLRISYRNRDTAGYEPLEMPYLAIGVVAPREIALE